MSLAGLRLSVLTRLERRFLWRCHRCGAVLTHTSINDHERWHLLTDPPSSHQEDPRAR